MGRKSGDDKAIPLNADVHMALHRHGNEALFLKEYGIDGPKLAEQLWEVSGDIEAGERIIRSAEERRMSEKTISEEAYMMACNAVGAKQYEIEVRDERIQELEAALEQERAGVAVLREALEWIMEHIEAPMSERGPDIDDIWAKANDALSSNPGAGVMEERDRYRDALQEIARSNCAGYILRGKEDRDELVELISEFYNEMRKRVQTAKAALNGYRDGR